MYTIMWVEITKLPLEPRVKNLTEMLQTFQSYNIPKLGGGFNPSEKY